MLFKKTPTRSNVARARLRSLAPGWVPTPELIERELAAARASSHPRQAGSHVSAEGSESLTQGSAQRATIELSQVPARGLLLVLVGALVGAVAVLLLGWPRGDAAPVEVTPIAGPTRGQDAAMPFDETLDETLDETQVVVDVAGLVKRPGIVELPSGSRITDALDAAGGALPRGDTSALNLAQLLTDGQQVVVSGGRSGAPAGIAAPNSGTSTGTSPGGLVSINSATLEQLETLPGIGPVLAQAIIDWRTENGAFTAIEQLQEVSGIGEATFADVSGLVGL